MLDMVCFVLGMSGLAITYSLNMSYELTERTSGHMHLALAARGGRGGRATMYLRKIY